ncbi:hypothetical protein VPH35_072946 [Triticum aestivum]|uniref:Uncharacterized protein n=1 Tax=Triticum turgidum subsp. durum TaxID=4567 RepID=A0A9R0WBA6_TRITD|nr:unnamed protein product [Triticum turgidum subsp. durum]
MCHQIQLQATRQAMIEYHVQGVRPLTYGHKRYSVMRIRILMIVQSLRIKRGINAPVEVVLKSWLSVDLLLMLTTCHGVSPVTYRYERYSVMRIGEINDHSVIADLKGDIKAANGAVF